MWKMANNFNLVHSLHLLLSTSICLHVSLERNINFVHEISHVKYNAFRKFLGLNIFGRKGYDKNFLCKLFGFETNANENKANYGNIYSYTCMKPIVYVTYRTTIL